MWSFWPLENYSGVKMNNAEVAQATTWKNLGNNGQVKGSDKGGCIVYGFISGN